MAKYLVLRSDGAYQQMNTVDTSDGAEDADQIPSLNADGVLDPSLLGAATTGADVVVLTGPDGRLDPTLMPTGVGADTASIVASEALSAGTIVNIFDSGGGVSRVRRADAGAGRPADGFVLETYAQDEPARVYFEGFNTQLADLVPGRAFLSLTPGGATSTAVTGAGNILQVLGVAYAPTILYFKPERPVYLA